MGVHLQSESVFNFVGICTYDNGTTHVVFTPLEFMARLASLVPPPWLNLTHYHGVFAPNHKLRSEIVKPRPKKQQEGNKPLSDSFRLTWAERLKRVFNIDVETCSKCGGKAKIIATIKNPVVIKKILDHVNSPQKSVSPAFQMPEAHAPPF